jgi:hypothetical protein
MGRNYTFSYLIYKGKEIFNASILKCSQYQDLILCYLHAHNVYINKTGII